MFDLLNIAQIIFFFFLNRCQMYPKFMLVKLSGNEGRNKSIAMEEWMDLSI